jgi:hypothetical protein
MCYDSSGLAGVDYWNKVPGTFHCLRAMTMTWVGLGVYLYFASSAKHYLAMTFPVCVPCGNLECPLL